MRQTPLEVVLYTAFTVTAVLWLAAGLDRAFRHEATGREVERLTGRLLASEQALADLRTGVLLAAIAWGWEILDW